MKYDDASWHYGGTFAEELPASAGATHIGMFLAWCLLEGMSGQALDAGNELAKLKAREISPGSFVMDFCDGKFTDEELNEEGNEFALAYFELESGTYASDYEKTLADKLPSLYHVKDSWESFDKLKPVIDNRFLEWTAKKYSTAPLRRVASERKPWWKVW